MSQLGLNSDSVLGYSIGEIKRSNTSETPELLPCGYLVGENTTISVTVKGNLADGGSWSFQDLQFLFCDLASETMATVCVGRLLYLCNHSPSYLSKFNGL